jgi:hypothetical protein
MPVRSSAAARAEAQRLDTIGDALRAAPPEVQQAILSTALAYAETGVRTSRPEMMGVLDTATNRASMTGAPLIDVLVAPGQFNPFSGPMFGTSAVGSPHARSAVAEIVDSMLTGRPVNDNVVDPDKLSTARDVAGLFSQGVGKGITGGAGYFSATNPGRAMSPAMRAEHNELGKPGGIKLGGTSFYGPPPGSTERFSGYERAKAVADLNSQLRAITQEETFLAAHPPLTAPVTQPPLPDESIPVAALPSMSMETFDAAFGPTSSAATGLTGAAATSDPYASSPFGEEQGRAGSGMVGQGSRSSGLSFEQAVGLASRGVDAVAVANELASGQPLAFDRATELAALGVDVTALTAPASRSPAPEDYGPRMAEMLGEVPEGHNATPREVDGLPAAGMVQGQYGNARPEAMPFDPSMGPPLVNDRAVPPDAWEAGRWNAGISLVPHPDVERVALARGLDHYTSSFPAGLTLTPFNLGLPAPDLPGPLTGLNDNKAARPGVSFEQAVDLASRGVNALSVADEVARGPLTFDRAVELAAMDVDAVSLASPSRTSAGGYTPPTPAYAAPAAPEMHELSPYESMAKSLSATPPAPAPGTIGPGATISRSAPVIDGPAAIASGLRSAGSAISGFYSGTVAPSLAAGMDTLGGILGNTRGATSWDGQKAAQAAIDAEYDQTPFGSEQQRSGAGMMASGLFGDPTRTGAPVLSGQVMPGSVMNPPQVADLRTVPDLMSYSGAAAPAPSATRSNGYGLSMPGIAQTVADLTDKAAYNLSEVAKTSVNPSIMAETGRTVHAPQPSGVSFATNATNGAGVALAAATPTNAPSMRDAHHIMAVAEAERIAAAERTAAMNPPAPPAVADLTRPDIPAAAPVGVAPKVGDRIEAAVRSPSELPNTEHPAFSVGPAVGPSFVTGGFPAPATTAALSVPGLSASTPPGLGSMHAVSPVVASAPARSAPAPAPVAAPVSRPAPAPVPAAARVAPAPVQQSMAPAVPSVAPPSVPSLADPNRPGLGFNPSRDNITSFDFSKPADYASRDSWSYSPSLAAAHGQFSGPAPTPAASVPSSSSSVFDNFSVGGALAGAGSGLLGGGLIGGLVGGVTGGFGFSPAKSMVEGISAALPSSSSTLSPFGGSGLFGGLGLGAPSWGGWSPDAFSGGYGPPQPGALGGGWMSDALSGGYGPSMSEAGMGGGYGGGGFGGYSGPDPNDPDGRGDYAG